MARVGGVHIDRAPAVTLLLVMACGRVILLVSTRAVVHA